MANKFLLLLLVIIFRFLLISTNFIQTTTARETLEVGIGIGIGIGGGGGGGTGDCSKYGDCPPSPSPPALPQTVCPPPPPPPLPPPPAPARRPPSPLPLSQTGFYNARIEAAFKAIQAFRLTITEDPMHITNTWRGRDVCRLKDKTKYKGFYCDKAPDTPPNSRKALALAAVDFNGYNLKSNASTVLMQNLPDLAFFHANSNGFKGSLSSIDFSKFPFFYELDVSNNKFSGAFPTNVFAIRNITFLDLRFNFFSGQVPPQLFVSYKLVEVIFLNNNGFSQPIPANIGRSPVKYLTLANNKFTGGIPPSIRFAANTLIEVLFLNNQLSGCLPYEIGFLEKATVFDAGYNWLTGPIPFSFGCLRKVEQLNFAGNLLYGQIPEVVCWLGNLRNLSLSDNYFTSVGPMCRKLIMKGILDARKNCILGLPKQRPDAECTAFFSKPLSCHAPPNYLTVPCQLSLSSFSSSSAMDEALPPLSSGVVGLPPSPSYTALTEQHGL